MKKIYNDERPVFEPIQEQGNKKTMTDYKISSPVEAVSLPAETKEPASTTDKVVKRPKPAAKPATLTIDVSSVPIAKEVEDNIAGPDQEKEESATLVEKVDPYVNPTAELVESQLQPYDLATELDFFDVEPPLIGSIDDDSPELTALILPVESDEEKEIVYETSDDGDLDVKELQIRLEEIFMAGEAASENYEPENGDIPKPQELEEDVEVSFVAAEERTEERLLIEQIISAIGEIEPDQLEPVETIVKEIENIVATVQDLDPTLEEVKEAYRQEIFDFASELFKALGMDADPSTATAFIEALLPNETNASKEDELVDLEHSGTREAKQTLLQQTTFDFSSGNLLMLIGRLVLMLQFLPAAS